MKKRILVVDDLFVNRDMLTDILCEDYDIETAEDGSKAIDQLIKCGEDFSAILLDLMMPNVDGLGVLDFMETNGLLRRIPVIIITGDNSYESEEKCFTYGVVDFVRKPFDDSLVKLRVRNAINLYEYKNNLEDKVSEQTKTLREQYLILQGQADILAKSNQKIIDILGTVVESRNLESGQHIQRVKSYTNILARHVMDKYPEYNLTEHIISVMVPASALHDVGKIAIPDSILLKPGRLTPEEFEIMKDHTTRGCDILNDIQGAWNDEYAKMTYEICRHHHERFDGKGYPDGLKGDEIPIASQIVSIADVYDALINKRVYKDAYAKNTAFEMILNGECGTFSPKILDCFKDAKEEFEKVSE